MHENFCMEISIATEWRGIFWHFFNISKWSKYSNQKMISQNCSVIFCCELLFLPEQLREMGGSRHIKTVQNHLEHKDTKDKTAWKWFLKVKKELPQVPIILIRSSGILILTDKQARLSLGYSKTEFCNDHSAQRHSYFIYCIGFHRHCHL